MFSRNKNSGDDTRDAILFNEMLIGALALTLLVGWTGLVSKSQSTFILLAASVAGVLPVIWSALQALRKREVTIDLLASIALIFTFIEGQWVSAVFINLMLASARLFDAFTEARTRNIIAHLLKFRPSVVKVQRNGRTEEIPLAQVKVGDRVVVESGDRVPIDGRVFSGSASIDQSTLTGESALVEKKQGDEVLSSTLNEFGSLVVIAERVGDDTTLSKIIALTDEASREKTKIEKVGNKFSAWYIGLTLVGSALLYLFSRDASLVLAVLLVVCADDIAVAVPLAFTVAISFAGKHGILLKGASAIERLKNVDTIVTDKTGTLTKGEIAVESILSARGVSQHHLLDALNYCSASSNHPVSRAIQRSLKERGIFLSVPQDFSETPGLGVKAKMGNHKFFMGRLSYLKDSGVEVSPDLLTLSQSLEEKGLGVTFVGKDDKALGIVGLKDKVRPHAKNAIALTKLFGVRSWVMLTGDNEKVAEAISKEVGLDEFHANLKPEEKLRFLRALKKQKRRIAMIGDGVNDAAALALADVGFAMGRRGADASIEASDVTLIRDDLLGVPNAILLSRRVFGVIEFNFVIWGATNLIGLFLVFGHIIGPVGASAYNFVTDFLPIINVFSLAKKGSLFTPKS